MQTTHIKIKLNIDIKLKTTQIKDLTKHNTPIPNSNELIELGYQNREGETLNKREIRVNEHSPEPTCLTLMDILSNRWCTKFVNAITNTKTIHKHKNPISKSLHKKEKRKKLQTKKLHTLV